MPSAPFPAVRSLRHGVLGAQAWVDSGHLDPESNARVLRILTPEEATVRRWRWPKPGLPPWLAWGRLPTGFRHILPHQQPQFSPSP